MEISFWQKFITERFPHRQVEILVVVGKILPGVRLGQQERVLDWDDQRAARRGRSKRLFAEVSGGHHLQRETRACASSLAAVFSLPQIATYGASPPSIHPLFCYSLWRFDTFYAGGKK